MAKTLRELREQFADAGRRLETVWGGTLIVPKDPEAEEAFVAAQAAVGRKEWAAAAELLQRVLDRPPGALLPFGEEGRVLLGAGALIERFLGGGPAELLGAYRAVQEPRAAALLGDAVGRHSAGLLAEVARRFGATLAGAQARRMLLAVCVEAGQYAQARGVLLEFPEWKGIESRALLVLFDEALQRSDFAFARQVLAQARDRPHGESPLWHGKEQAFQESIRGPLRAPATGVRPLWRFENGRVADPSAARRMDFPEEYDPYTRLRGLMGVPVLPSVEGGDVLFQDGRQMTAVRLDGGGLVTQGAPSRIEYGIGYERHLSHATAASGPSMLAPFPATSPVYDPRVGAVVTLPSQDLVCSDRKTGKVRWKARETAFRLGKPYPDGFSFPVVPAVAQDAKTAYAPASMFKGLFSSFLAALSMEDGRPLWKTYLCSGQQEMNYFGRPLREAVPSPPALEAGRVYLSTNLGVVAALDAAAGHLLWLFQYSQVEQPNQKTEMYHIRPRLSGWKNVAPVVLADRLIVAPADSPFVYALDCATGGMIWSAQSEPSQSEHLLVDPLTGTVCAYGQGGARGIDAATGKVRWSAPLRGAATHAGCAAQGGFYFFSGDSLIGLDAGSGKRRFQADGKILPGPLWTDGSRFVVTGRGWVEAWELTEAEMEGGKKAQ